MHVEPFFDPATWTLTYVVSDEATKDAVVIDPVLDYDPKAVTVSTASNDKVVEYVRREGLTVRYILETHAHADHLTGAVDLKERLGASVAIGSKITTVQQLFRDVFDMGDDLPADGSQFDRLLEDGDVLEAGSLRVRVLHTPGHTPACASYVIGDAVFTGDALFLPDSGTGRCDFPAGSATDLYRSIQDKLYTLPDETRVFVGHDYQPGGRDVAWVSTIGEEKAANIQLPADRDEATFVSFRTARDQTLRPPNLIFQSVQVNANGGRLPPPAANGRRYLKLPIGLLG